MILARLAHTLPVILAASLVLASHAGAQERALDLMPQPAKVQAAPGSLRILPSFSVSITGYREARLDRAVQRFLNQLTLLTGFPPTARPAASSPAVLVLNADHASKEVQELGEEESYTLEVTPSGAKLSAANPLGILRGLQTFLQLVRASPEGFTVPALTIEDQPRFAWRGLMIDSARHFTPLDVIRRNLDGLEAVKMNVFHWHLSENQGFRVESKKLPKLHTLGSDGLFYTQDEIREIVAYARDRGIRVVPEFDMPGHSTSWFVGHPELASGPGPYQIERKWGVFDPAMDPSNEKVYKFLDEFIAEMARLFPDRFFHIGGDEVNGKEWDGNPKIQEFKRAHSLKTNEELQAFFSQRVQKLVTRHGKSVIGWDEVFIAGVPKDIVIQSWRGPEALASAAKQGYRGILSNGYYLDLGHSAARHYGVDPLGGAAATLTDDQKKFVLGGESCMWSEYVNQENIDSRIWPRNAAIAERLWSPQNVADPASMYARLDFISGRLEWLGLTHRTYYRKMLERIAGDATPEELMALGTLADVLEPVKEYTREQTAPAEATSATPLNRMVDAVSLESDQARRFADLVARFLAASGRDPQLAARLREDLSRWRDSDAKLQALFARSSLAGEAAGTSKDLSLVAAAGLEALDLLAKGSRPDDSWKSQKLAILAEAQKSKVQLLLVPAPAVQKLVEAAAAGSPSAAR